MPGAAGIEAPMAKPHVVLFHEALCRIVRARGLVGDRVEKARAAIDRYVHILKRAAGLGSGAAGIDKAMIDRELMQLEEQIKQWKLLGSDTALVCDAALALVRRERVENLCDRRVTDVVPQSNALRNSHTGLLVK
jgi:hypothetical protein